MNPEEVKEASLLAINVYEIIFQMINFGILYFLLKKFLAKPLSDLLSNRANKIKHNIESAELKKIKSDELFKKQSEELKSAQVEAQAIRKKAEDSAKKELETIVQSGKESAQKILDQAKVDIDVQMAQAKKDLLKDVGLLATQVVQKFVSSEMSDKEKEASMNRLVGEMVDS